MGFSEWIDTSATTVTSASIVPDPPDTAEKEAFERFFISKDATDRLFQTLAWAVRARPMSMNRSNHRMLIGGLLHQSVNRHFRRDQFESLYFDGGTCDSIWQNKIRVKMCQMKVWKPETKVIIGNSQARKARYASDQFDYLIVLGGGSPKQRDAFIALVSEKVVAQALKVQKQVNDQIKYAPHLGHCTHLLHEGGIDFSERMALYQCTKTPEKIDQLYREALHRMLREVLDNVDERPAK